MKQADLRDALWRDHDQAIRVLLEDLNNVMQVVSMLTEAVRDLNTRLVKFETGGTDDIELGVTE